MDELRNTCPWLFDDSDSLSEEKCREFDERDWMRWYGEEMLPAARNDTKKLEEVSAIGRQLAYSGWRPSELTAVSAEAKLREFRGE